MKKIEAVIGHSELEAVREGLAKLSLTEELIVNGVKGFDRNQGQEKPLDSHIWVEPVLKPKVHIELVVADDGLALKVEELFGKHADTGKVVVTPIDSVFVIMDDDEED